MEIPPFEDSLIRKNIIYLSENLNVNFVWKVEVSKKVHFVQTHKKLLKPHFLLYIY